MAGDLFPILRLELAGIRQSMEHAFHSYQVDLSAMVKAELDKLVTAENFSHMIAVDVKAAFEKSVKRAIESYFEYGEGRRAIEAEINKSLGTHRREREATS